MDFGKLSDINGIDFLLPPDNEATADVLAQFAKSDALQVFVGCTGWGMKEWVGKWYPTGAKPPQFLGHYGQQFNTIELNATHYRTPDVATVRNWLMSVPEDFRFCPKVLQAISHSRNLGTDTGQVTAFTEAISGLDAKLGCCFLQLPPTFGVRSLPILERFIEMWPSYLPLAVEARHTELFSDPAAGVAYFSLLEAYQVGAVLTDVAGRRDVLHQRLTNSTAMIRFVGNGLHPTDFLRIDAWVNRLMEWHSQGLREVFFFTHEPDNILAPELASYLCTRFQVHNAVVLRGPKNLAADSGQQMSLF